MTNGEEDSSAVARPLRLEHISTRQDVVADPAKFVVRYGAAIIAYLTALLCDRDSAEEVLQEFLVRLVERGLPDRMPDRGRFRDYLKVTIRNAAITEIRKQRVRQSADVDIESLSWIADADANWTTEWRSCLLDSAWRKLEQHQRKSSGNFAYSCLKISVDFPDNDSNRLAERLSESTGVATSATAFRKQLSRARKRFSELIRNEIANTLDEPTAEFIDAEIAELGLRPFIPSEKFPEK